MIDAAFWRGRRVFVTGHTGFKGTWLVTWLGEMGAVVHGLSLPPATRPNMFDLLRPNLAGHVIGDIRDAALVRRAMAEAKPEVVLHLAAQALVRPGYDDPLGTLATNVMGTAHVLEAVRSLPSVQAVVVVTTDKVYQNLEEGRPFVEDDPLSGRDPYSGSKACAEIVTRLYDASYFDGGARIVAARAGNVIGGGDWSEYRLVPDVVRAYEAGIPVTLRYPQAVRPWQHVLEPLSGYLLMAQEAAAGSPALPAALNFAPEPQNFQTVATVVEQMSSVFGGRPGWVTDGDNHPYEAKFLTLSADKARQTLGWRPRLDFADTMEWTGAWYRAHWDGRDMAAVTGEQIGRYRERLVDPQVEPAFVEEAR